MKNTITIGLAGDVMIGRLVNEALDQTPPKYIWGDVLPLLKSNDFNLINLEAALTVSTKEVPKTFNFKADPHKVQALVEASIDVVNLANNHTLDYSVEGLLETLQTLDKAKIAHVGAGKNRAEARAPVIKNVHGIIIGILGCTDNEPAWEAGENKPGTFYLRVGDFAAIKEEIESLRKEVDIVILSIHWGPNMRERPTSEFKNFARKLIDHGVDIIHGHSAHIFQGIEIYKEGLILYDTGDFVDDYYVDPQLRNDRSFLFLVDVQKTGFKHIQLVPVRISNYQVNIAKGEDAQTCCLRMKQLSKEFQTDFISNEVGLEYIKNSG